MDTDLSTLSTAKQQPTVNTDRPRWAPFFIVLAVLATLAVIPVVLLLLAPDRGENMVGVYERVTFEEDHDGSRVIAGFIAPQGWQRAAPESDGADGESGSDDVATDEGAPVEDAEFTAADNSAWIYADLHLDVASPALLLRESAPIGAALSPVQALDVDNGLDTHFIEYDLGAGTGVSQIISACKSATAPSCLLFRIEEQGYTHPAGTILPEMAAILKTAEVY